jgi:hypothetical protein
MGQSVTDVLLGSKPNFLMPLLEPHPRKLCMLMCVRLDMASWVARNILLQRYMRQRITQWLPLETKNQAGLFVKQVITFIEQHKEHKIKYLRSDNGTEIIQNLALGYLPRVFTMRNPSCTRRSRMVRRSGSTAPCWTPLGRCSIQQDFRPCSVEKQLTQLIIFGTQRYHQQRCFSLSVVLGA